MGDSHATALLYSIFFLKSVCYARFIYLRMLKRCVRLSMVGRIMSGASETSRKIVFSGGSSRSFSSLLAQGNCIFQAAR